MITGNNSYGYPRMLTDSNSNSYPLLMLPIAPETAPLERDSVLDVLGDPEFIEACRRAGVNPSRRQAAKYRNRRGKAFAASLEMAMEKNPGSQPLPEGRAKRAWEDEI